jgi:cytochrome subunit of sulfide dehydrogenase
MIDSPRRPARSHRTSLVPAFLILLIVGQSAIAQRADIGRDVAATCASCHGTDGASVGSIQSLAGRPKDELLVRMRDFNSGARSGTVMPQLAKGYTDEQIDAVCGWFAAQRSAR